MSLPFYKYHGTGNDFVMIDQRTAPHIRHDEQELIARLCHRNFGIGADGLVLLELRDGYDFEMAYFNADGRPSSMCGNGARCTVAFARDLGIQLTEYHFWAPDGPHRARVAENGWIEVEMAQVEEVEQGGNFLFLNTGSPHYIRFVEDAYATDTVAEGRQVRYSERFREEGTNVNFVENTPQGLRMTTYERGVENETLSCGTGVTAAAIAAAASARLPADTQEVAVSTKGGELKIRFQQNQAGQFRDIWLCGPAAYVFEGKVDLTAIRLSLNS